MWCISNAVKFVLIRRSEVSDDGDAMVETVGPIRTRNDNARRSIYIRPKEPVVPKASSADTFLPETLCIA